MSKTFLKVSGYILIRYLGFYISSFFVDPSMTGLSKEDLQDSEDLFMFIWIFILPIIIDIVVFSFPLSFTMKRIDAKSEVWPYFLLLCLFIVEYAIANWVIGYVHSILKVSISIAVFVLMFGRQLLRPLHVDKERG